MAGLEYIPYLLLSVFALAVVFILYTIFSPMKNGVPLGILEITGNTVDGRFYEEFKGTVVDMTEYYVNDNMEEEFRVMVSQELQSAIRAGYLSNEEGLAMQTLVSNLQNNQYKMTSLFRVLGIRKLFGAKQILIQYGTTTSLLTLARVSKSPKFSLSLLSAIAKGRVMGHLYTTQSGRKWDIPGVGKAVVHFFKPITGIPLGNPTPPTSAFESLGKLALFVRTTLESKEHIRTLEQREEDLTSQNADLSRELSASKTLNDSLLISVAGFTTQGENWKPPVLGSHSLSTGNAISLVAFTAGAGAVSTYAGINPVLGAVVGVFAALLYINWFGKG